MAPRLSIVDERSDAELISAVRGGDVDSYGELFSRHVDAARRLGRQLVPGPDVDDLVSEAFAKMLVVLQRGGGPDLAFRAYLLTAVRRLHIDRIRSTSRLHTTDDLTPFDPGVPFRDTAVEGFESAAAARAFASLPERWQLVLWHTEVEGQKPAEVATLLGMSANSVSALAYRAREGLRQAYLSMHASTVEDDDCERARAQLGGYVRGGLSRREAARVEQHLESCRACAAIYLELTEVNSNLRALIAPLLLGAAAAGYLGSAAGSVSTGGVVVLLGRARDAVVSHASTAAVAGAATAAVVAGVAITLHQQHRPRTPSAGDHPVVRIEPTGTPKEPTLVRREGPRPPSSPAAGGPTTSTDSAPTGGQTTAPATNASASPPTVPSGPQPGPPSSPPTTPPTAPPTVAPTGPDARLVQVSAGLAAGPDGVTVNAGVGVAGIPVVPDMTLTIPVPNRP